MFISAPRPPCAPLQETLAAQLAVVQLELGAARASLQMAAAREQQLQGQIAELSAARQAAAPPPIAAAAAGPGAATEGGSGAAGPRRSGLSVTVTAAANKPPGLPLRACAPPPAPQASFGSPSKRTLHLAPAPGGSAKPRRGGRLGQGPKAADSTAGGKPQRRRAPVVVRVGRWVLGMSLAAVVAAAGAHAVRQRRRQQRSVATAQERQQAQQPVDSRPVPSKMARLPWAQQ